MTEFLSTVLDFDELSQITPEVREKLEKELKIRSSCVDQAQSEVERVKADYEQKCYEIDKRIIEMSGRLDTETSNAAKAASRCQELEEELVNSREKSTGIEMSFAECQGEIAALKHTHDLWKDEKLSMQHLIEKRDLEITGLKSEWKVLSDKLTAATSAKNDAELKLDELQNSGVTVQYHNKRLEREKELLSEQNKQLSDDVKAKSMELGTFKLNKDNEIVALRGRLEIKMDECKQLGLTTENLRTTNDNLEKKISELLEKVKTLEGENHSMEELYREELQAQVKLTELYQASQKDEEKKASELASAVQELQKLVMEADEVSKEYQLEAREAQKKRLELIEETELLKKELEKANDLLVSQKEKGYAQLSEEDLAALSPAAAMASKFMKSGMTLTEIYTRYIEVVDELDTAKLESKRLNEAMDAILEELNEKAPVLKQQREDYERALATISQLTSQMDAAAIECQHLRAEADDAARKVGRMERENKRMQMETKDLSTQVKFLLKQLEESRGRHVEMNTSMREHDGSFGDDSYVTSSSEVITGQLVTFKDIEGLQRQNQKLLRVVRELSDESEKRESENQSDEMKRLKESLDDATEELEKLRADRGRQTEFVEAIVRQRDMYRVLLAQESSASLPLSVFGSPSPLPPGQSQPDVDKTPKRKSLPDSGETSKALQALKAEYDEYRKEVQGNNKVLNEQTDNLRSQVSELRADNAKLQARVDFSAEKYAVMKQSFDNARKESDIHREKNSKLLVLVQKHEMSLNNATNELSRTQQEKTKLSAQLDTTRGELDILRRTEDRLRAENSSLQRDHLGQTVLLTNLQKIQQTMEKQEFEVRSELRSRLESQERELKSLRRNNQDTVQQKQAILQMTEKQLLTTRQNLEMQKKQNDAVSSELRGVKSELEMAKSEKQSVETKLVTLEQRLARLATQKGVTAVNLDVSENAGEELKDIKTKCSSLQEEISSLKLKLDKSQNAVQQHREVANAAEASLNQANIANRELSEALEARLRNASEHQTKLEQRITTLEDENRQLNSKKTSLISEVDLRTADLNRQHALLQAELDLTVKREKESRKSEQEARDQFSEQMNLIHEAQSKYQREMLLHAESVKELMELKEKCNTHDTELDTAKSEAQQAKHLLDSNKGMWEKQKVKMTEENDQLKERNEDMSKQITLLHEQVETMSNQLVALQVKQTTSPGRLPQTKEALEASTTSIEGSADKSSEQLMDIIKFLRKEKNLYETKYEVAQSESNRLKQQMTHIQKQLDETKKSLHVERQKLQASSSELSQHQSLMKKVETMNVLSDSNHMLREEKERLQAELQTTKAKLTETKQQITPLQIENNQFSTQIATLKSEKAMLEQDVQRWQQRSQQLLQSPRRQDPEEYRRLINEKQKLSKNVDELNKELTDRKLEVSNLQGEIRNLNQQAESHKNENASLTKRAEAAEADTKTKQTEIEEKAKTIMQIRRVGRRYKTQYEELQKKQQELEARQKSAEETKAQDTSASEAALAENNAKLSALEASLTKAIQEKEDSKKQLEVVSAEVEVVKTQLQQANQRSAEESSVSSSEVVEENQKLINERDEMRKQLQEKEDKSKRLLTMAKNRIEQIRKEKDESVSERERLRAEEERLKEEIEKLKQDVKLETEQKAELQSKVEDLQKQLTSVSSQQPQQSKVTGHQIHHHAGSSGAMELRKAANIRPISTRVSQVSPMRVTRTARVMPEPQQEAQEGTSLESLPTRSSPLGQVAPSSSHPIASVSANTTTTLPTRAFVHPINPSSGHQQHVVSSMPTSSGTHQQPSRSDAHQAEQAVMRGSSVATDNQPQESSVSSLVATSSGNIAISDVSESDQAIVSSSDDQPMGHDEGQQAFAPPTSGSSSQSSSSTSMAESEAAPSQSNSASSSGDGSGVASSGMVSGIPVHVSRQAQIGHKRSYDDADNSSSGQAEAAASSSDVQVSVAPMSKRQRSSPDQSSAAVPPMASQAHTSRAFAEGTTRIEQAESSMLQSEVKSSSEADVEASTMPKSVIQEAQESSKESDADTSTFSPIQEPTFTSTVSGRSVPTSSGTGEVIVLSSDSEDDNVEQTQDEMYEEEGMIVEPEAEAESNLQDLTSQVPRSSMRPSLVLHPTPDIIARNRAPIRPAPLTPGLVQPSTDDGDGIVPCTPTLPTRRHDDNYQTINSPHVPPGGPPIRFRFEDVAVPGPSFQSQSGIGSVDNTLMDFGGAGDEPLRVPTAPMVTSTITTITHSIVEPAQMSSEVSAVSSSIAEQGEIVDEKDDLEEEMCVPNSSSSLVEVDDMSREAAGETTSNLLNTRGRRIRLIGARSRGKGGSSPSTSSQQP